MNTIVRGVICGCIGGVILLAAGAPLWGAMLGAWVFALYCDRRARA